MMKKLLLLSTICLVTTFGFSQEKTEIEGAIIIKDSEAATPEPGTIRFNSTTNDFEGWNGLYWASLTGHQYEIGEMMDQDGNTYPTIIIGSQEWMAANLRTTKYRNGDDVVFIDNSASGYTSWGDVDYGAYAVYDTTGTGHPFDLEKFGYLYNWYAVDDSRELCPTGWHVVTDAEWTTLTDLFGGANEAGGSLRETSTTYWNSPHPGSTNVSGFTALPGGGRSGNGHFSNIRNFGFFWSSTEQSNGYAWYRNLNYGNDYVIRLEVEKKFGFAVRCVKD